MEGTAGRLTRCEKHGARAELWLVPPLPPDPSERHVPVGFWSGTVNWIACQRAARYTLTARLRTTPCGPVTSSPSVKRQGPGRGPWGRTTSRKNAPELGPEEGSMPRPLPSWFQPRLLGGVISAGRRLGPVGPPGYHTHRDAHPLPSPTGAETFVAPTSLTLLARLRPG